jgi:hypothetical protein
MLADVDARTRGDPGRPATRGDKVTQLLTMAHENPSWGYTRLRGALENLGFDLGRSTIQRMLTQHGIESDPLRGRTMPWKTFLKAHWGAIAAADFFSVEVLTCGGLVRYLVLFVIDLKTRRVHIAGVTCAADGAWMAQVARNLTDAAAGPLTGFGQLHRRSGSALYGALPDPAASRGRTTAAPAVEEPEPQRLRREIRSVDQARVPPARCPPRRTSSARRRARVRGALPR